MEIDSSNTSSHMPAYSDVSSGVLINLDEEISVTEKAESNPETVVLRKKGKITIKNDT